MRSRYRAGIISQGFNMIVALKIKEQIYSYLDKTNHQNINIR